MNCAAHTSALTCSVLAFVSSAVTTGASEEPLSFDEPALFARMDDVDWEGWTDLRGLLTDIHERTGVPGLAAAFVRDGEVVAQATVGVDAVGEDAAIGDDARFHLGSVTKSMTALWIARVVEEGVLEWTTTVGEALDDLPMREGYRAVTIEQLLRHRGGLPAYTHGRPEGHDADKRYTGTAIERRASFLADVLRVEPVGEPGQTSLYSNAGYALAGHIAETMSAASFEEGVASRVFEPLDMSDSGFGFPERPLGHARVGTALAAVPLDGYPDMAVIAPAGNVHATAGDLARYAAAHLRGLDGGDGLVSSETWRRLHRDSGDGYAAGWRVGVDRSGRAVHWHGGTVGASYAEVRLFPESRSGVVFLTTVPMGIGEAIARQVTKALMKRFGAPAPSGFVTAGEPAGRLEIITESSTAEDDARFWRVIDGLSRAINDEDRDAFHAHLAATYNRRDADSLFDFMARNVLPSRGGVHAFHDASPPFRMPGKDVAVRTVTFHTENGFPGYFGITLDDDEKVTQLSLFIKSDLCRNGVDRRCDKITRKLEDAQR